MVRLRSDASDFVEDLAGVHSVVVEHVIRPKAQIEDVEDALDFGDLDPV